MSAMSDLDARIQELEAIGARLRTQGFDACGPLDTGGIRVGCTQCDALVINGVPCHESGCVRQMRECSGCSNLIPALRFRRFCDDCA